MPSVSIDPNALLRILTNMDDPNRRFPGPQNKEQIQGRQEYADSLMKNMQLQGGANYVPMNALADTIRGYMGGRYLEKNERAVRDIGERHGRITTQATFPNYGGQASYSQIKEPIMPEAAPNRPPMQQPQQQDAGQDTLTDADRAIFTQNPDAPAWQQVANTEQGRVMGPKWAKEAIWKNVPDDLKPQFGTPDNITSGQFMQMVGNKRHMARYAQPSASPIHEDMQFGQAQTLDQKMLDPTRQDQLSLRFNPQESIEAGFKGNNSPLLDQPPQQVGNQVGQAGQDILPGPRPEPTIPAIGAPGQTTIPKTSPGIPKPPEGTFRQEAAIPNTDDQFAGTTQTRQPERNVTQMADGGGDPSNEGQGLLNIPTSPSSNIRPNQLYDIMKDPALDPQIKMHFLQQAQQQGQMQGIPVEGGKVYYNPRTGQQLYVPEPKWGSISVGGVNVPAMSIRRKMNGPWETFLMDGTPVGSQGGGAEGGQESGGGSEQGGLEGLHQRGVNMDRRKQLTENQTKLQSGEREQHAKAGELAEKSAVALQRLRQLENAPDINNITTGMTAPAWNEFKKTMNAWLPGTIAKEGPISLHDVYNAIATQAAASLARASDSNPSVKQFEAMLATNPGYAQTPAGRKALLLSLEHVVNLERDIGKVAKSSEAITSPDEYNRRVQEIRTKYAQKKIIPDKLLDPRFIASKEFKNMKWMTEGDEENMYRKMRPGEVYMDTKGNVRIKGGQ